MKNLKIYLLITFAVIGLSVNAQTLGAGASHSLSICTDSTVRAWGFDGYGAFGYGSGGGNQTAPVAAMGLTGVVSIKGGSSNTIALKSDGTVWATGHNSRGELGVGDVIDRGVPVQMIGMTGITAITSGGETSFALKNNGTVWGCGINADGEIGNGTQSTTGCMCINTPVQVTGLTGIIAIAAGSDFSIALKNDGTVWGWGFNQDGEIGTGTLISSLVPVQTSITGVVAIACGAGHCLAIRNDGTVWAWGQNNYGQMGNGTVTSS